MKETVFITGATGFVGGVLARFLNEQGYSIRCLVRKNSKIDHLKDLNADLLFGDVLDPEIMKKGAEGALGVFHLAGLISALKANDFYKINAGGFRNAAEACLTEKKRSGRAPVLLAVSSLACAGPARQKEDDRILPQREIFVPRPVSHYGKSKLKAEKILTEYAGQIPITIVRPPFVIGEGNRPCVSLFEMAANSWMFPGSGYIDRLFSFVHADDLVQMMLGAALKGERLQQDSLEPFSAAPQFCRGTGIYFTAMPEIVSFFEFGSMIAEAYGQKKIVRFRVPPLGVIGAAVFMEGVKRIRRRFVSFDWNKMTESLTGPWICSADKIINLLDYKFEKDLKERIAQTAQGYLDRGMIVLNPRVKRSPDRK